MKKMLFVFCALLAFSCLAVDFVESKIIEDAAYRASWKAAPHTAKYKTECEKIADLVGQMAAARTTETPMAYAAVVAYAQENGLLKRR